MYYEWLDIITADVLLTADFVSALEIAWGHGDLGSAAPPAGAIEFCTKSGSARRRGRARLTRRQIVHPCSGYKTKKSTVRSPDLTKKSTVRSPNLAHLAHTHLAHLRVRENV